MTSRASSAAGEITVSAFRARACAKCSTMLWTVGSTNAGAQVCVQGQHVTLLKSRQSVSAVTTAGWETAQHSHCAPAMVTWPASWSTPLLMKPVSFAGLCKNGACVCTSGYDAWTDCATKGCPGDGSCGSHGTCGANGVCDCDAGWDGPDCALNVCGERRSVVPGLFAVYYSGDFSQVLHCALCRCCFLMGKTPNRSAS